MKPDFKLSIVNLKYDEFSNIAKDIRLQEDTLHIWEVNLDSQNNQSSLIKNLSLDEQHKAEQFYFNLHRQRFITCRGILRILLGNYLEIEPNKIRLFYGEHGKPSVEESRDSKKLQFNVSHSQGLALLAFMWNHQVGIDIEYIRPISSLEHLTKRFFFTKEHNVIHSLPLEQRYKTFWQYWTCKEACLKATGTGLFALNQVEIELSDEKHPKLLRALNSLNPNHWILQSLTLDHNHIGAFVVG